MTKNNTSHAPMLWYWELALASKCHYFNIQS